MKPCEHSSRKRDMTIKQQIAQQQARQAWKAAALQALANGSRFYFL